MIFQCIINNIFHIFYVYTETKHNFWHKILKMKQSPAEHKSRVAIMVAVLMKYNCSVTSQPCSLPPATIVPIFHCKCNLVKLAHYSKLQSLCAPERRSDTLPGGDGGRLYGSSISPPVIKYFSSPRGAPQLHPWNIQAMFNIGAGVTPISLVHGTLGHGSAAAGVVAASPHGSCRHHNLAHFLRRQTDVSTSTSTLAPRSRGRSQ